ncbi:MAG: H-NS histone family protein [Paracoccaceae bacterium]
MNEDDLAQLESRIQARKREVAEQGRKDALEAARAAAREHGYELEDLMGGKARKSGAKSKSSGAAKYRNPDDASQTWTGRGRQPAWFKAKIEDGVAREDMEV